MNDVRLRTPNRCCFIGDATVLAVKSIRRRARSRSLRSVVSAANERGAVAVRRMATAEDCINCAMCRKRTPGPTFPKPKPTAKPSAPPATRRQPPTTPSSSPPHARWRKSANELPRAMSGGRSATEVKALNGTSNGTAGQAEPAAPRNPQGRRSHPPSPRCRPFRAENRRVDPA
jgi:hypothetical protein